MKIFLQTKALLRHDEGQIASLLPTATIAQLEKRHQLESKTLGFFVTSVDKNLATPIIDCESPVEAWNILEKQYMPKPSTRRLEELGKFSKMRCRW
ncbi:hypothetical protein CHUAL_000024 [Chamberlinius hualienensis]